MTADDTTTRGDVDLEATHQNPRLDSTVFNDTVPAPGNAAFDGTAFRDGASADVSDGAAPADEEPEEEWPPREWRETTRSAGHRQAAYVALGMVAMFAVLVVVAIWASHNG